MNKDQILFKAVREVKAAAKRASDAKELYKVVVRRLAKLPHFNWTGIYLLKGHTLELDHFIGRPTEHMKIPVGKGICGSAMSRGGNVIIDDVTMESNYLACSIETRSEIVVLIRDGKRIIGEIDIDSDEPAAFDDKDERALESVAQIIAQRLREIGNEPRHGRKKG
jgi:L-methionine (R)-S-oxide reductase